METLNKCVKFYVKIQSRFWELAKNLRGYFSDLPCITYGTGKKKLQRLCRIQFMGYCRYQCLRWRRPIRLRANIIRTALCWIVWHNVHSQQHTYMSSSYRSNRLGLSHWDPYAVHRDSCLELYFCNMVEWFLWDSSLISTTDWFQSSLK